MDEGFVVVATIKGKSNVYLNKTMFYSNYSSHTPIWCEPFYAQVYKTDKEAQKVVDTLLQCNRYKNVKFIKTNSKEFNKYLNAWKKQFKRIYKNPINVNPVIDKDRIRWFPKATFVHDWFILYEYEGLSEIISLTAHNKLTLPFVIARTFYNMKHYEGRKLTKFKIKRLMYDNGQLYRETDADFNCRDDNGYFHNLLLVDVDEIKKRPVLYSYKDNIASYKKNVKNELDKMLKNVSYPLI